MLTPWRYGNTIFLWEFKKPLSLEVNDGYCGFRFWFYFFFNILVFISECLVVVFYHSGN